VIDESGFDLQDIRRKAEHDTGTEWWSKYGDASYRAALALFGIELPTEASSDCAHDDSDQTAHKTSRRSKKNG
jgi:hypothetical protein